MNYRHIYHAGNFGDVFKHLTLIQLITNLKKKENSFCFVDTHAGSGKYDLLSENALKTQEFSAGIAQLINKTKYKVKQPSVVQTYFNIILANNPQEKNLHAEPLRYYPGSPLIARSLLRAHDRMILSELHPQEFATLKQLFYLDKQVAVHHLDAYQTLKALLPPIERRGLVLIDPPYEQVTEFEQIIVGLKSALQRWQTGIYAIWYPLTKFSKESKWINQVTQLNVKEILHAQLTIYPEDAEVGLHGCGIAILNPPWKLNEQLNELLPWLWQILSTEGAGRYHLDKYS